jgi:hypothetical protein
MSTHPFGTERLKILVAEPRRGTPVLEIRNHLRRRRLPEPEIHAITAHAKYYEDLRAVCEGVVCASFSEAESFFGQAAFDVAVLCEPESSNGADNLIESALRLVKPRGLLLFKRRDANTGIEYAHSYIKEES